LGTAFVALIGGAFSQCLLPAAQVIDSLQIDHSSPHWAQIATPKPARQKNAEKIIAPAVINSNKQAEE